jgi:hypothetical protein
MHRLGKHASTIRQLLCFLSGPCGGVILKRADTTVQLRVQLRDIRRTVTMWARKAEEHSLLEATVRERLLKTKQDGKTLNGCCGNLWILEISRCAVSKRSSEWCIQVVNTSITNPYPSIFTPLNTSRCQYHSALRCLAHWQRRKENYKST